MSTRVPIITLHCMGQDEVFYSYDYFYNGGYSAEKEVCNYENLVFSVPCTITFISGILVWSNLIDIYLLFRIIHSLKHQTNSVHDLLTPRALMQRRR